VPGERGEPTLAPVIGRLARRLAEAVVALFALYAFCFVPLGSRTGLEHARAVLTTPAARRAAGELAGAAVRVHRALVDALRSVLAGGRTRANRPGRPPPGPPAAPAASHGALDAGAGPGA
jgi:hypothetical protein